MSTPAENQRSHPTILKKGIKMTSFLKSINEELTYLTSLDKELENDSVIPKRYAVLLKSHDDKDYYWDITKTAEKTKPVYLGDADSTKLHTIARSSYKKELMKIVKHNIKILKKAVRGYRSYKKSDIIAKLSPCLHDLEFKTEFDSIMKELREWAEADYERNPAPFKGGVIRAKDGTRVRSRAECIIYNLLLEAGVPFRYEPVLKFKRMNKNGEVEEYSESPDFLIKCPDGSFIIIEHAGLLTLAQYADDLARKLQIYQLNGYWIGRTLFVTSEDYDGGIDSQQISILISCIRERFPYL